MNNHRKRDSIDSTTETVTIEKLDSNGSGLGRLSSGQIVFVPGVLPEELVRIRVHASDANFLHGSLIEILEPSPKRIQPDCPFFTECNHCKFQNLQYEDQLVEKRNILIDQLTRIGKLTDAKNIVQPCLPSPANFGYRAQMIFFPQPDGAFALAGRHREPVPIDRCPICRDGINELLQQIAFEPDSGIEAIEIREDRYEMHQLILYGNSEKPDNELETDLPISIVYIGSAAPYVMSGDSTLVQMVADLEIASSESANFFQNPEIFSALCNELEKHLQCNSESNALILNSKTGFWTKWLAKSVNHAFAVEQDDEALVDDFLLNLNELDHISLYLGRVHEVVPQLDQPIDLIIADGEKHGISAHDIRTLCHAGAQTIVYLCDDSSLFSRDVARFIENKCVLRTIIPYDKEPQTNMIPALAIFDTQPGEKQND